MARADIIAGICGFKTTVKTEMDGTQVAISVQSECDAIQRLGDDLPVVDPWQEITFRGEGPLTLKMGAKHCYHPACPVPVGIIKAIEVKAGLALPMDVSIKLSKPDD